MEAKAGCLVVIKVQYERSPTYGRSLRWIAPELDDADFLLVEDQMDDGGPSRTWTGIVDARTFERFATAWRLPGDMDARGPGGSYVFDGMNWESNGGAPILSVTVKLVGLGAATAKAWQPSAET